MIQSVIKGSNAHLIRTIRPLYIPDGALVLDTTYGRGGFWTEYRPRHMTIMDAKFGDDFRRLPAQWTDTYDVVVFDPPYVCKGGRATSGIQEMDDRYGLVDAPATPAEMRKLHTDGLVECERVLNVGGTLLVKMGDYISSGHYQSGLNHLTFVTTMLGLEQVDLFIHYTHPGPQPKGRRQVHGRRAHTYLVVYRKLRPRVVAAHPQSVVLQSESEQLTKGEQ